MDLGYIGERARRCEPSSRYSSHTHTNSGSLEHMYTRGNHTWPIVGLFKKTNHFIDETLKRFEGSILNEFVPAERSKRERALTSIFK